MKIKNYNVISLFALVVSPFIAIPSILFGLTKKNGFSLGLLLVTYTLLSYQITPYTDNDLAKHYRYFDLIENMNWNQLLELIKNRADSFFYLLMFIFSKVNLNAQSLFAFITFVILGNFLYVFHKLFREIKIKTYLVGLILLLLSFQWSHLLLGVRNYFAFSFVVVSFYRGIITDKKYGFLWIIFASTIHFSSLLFIPIYFLLTCFRNKKNLPKSLFLYTLILVFLSKEFLLDLALLIPLPEKIEEKVIWYLTGQDLVERDESKTFSGKILFTVLGLWTYLGYGYLLLTLKRKSVIRNIVYLLFFILNLFTVAPDPYRRYAYVVRPFFLFLLLYEFVIYKKPLPIYLFLILILMFAFVDFYVTKNVYISSFLNWESLTTICIITKEPIINELN
jgi:hypothetical protein